ncbi:beta strand repeat-containing protein [Bythopirellula polymerisocia]|uniref:Inverse autotransporter beta-domain domain-containing protein n=1 Tax=Bythopirellula polymerisocia TaxID=2528003 RepID=A0A5C6CZR5_9BACT|nr:hypothetical protein [Bythopirellula polymerisocia]TWU28159.1 hypothetical protein Pla144_14460 [Bythopirellula polymerisocia]
MRNTIRLLLSYWPTIIVALLSLSIPHGGLYAQVDQALATSSGSESVLPVSYTSSGNYFSRELGTPLRFGYHTEGYGTETGVVSLGTMPVFPLDNAVWFVDAAGTLSEDFGGGFNLGVGYREMVDFNRGFDSERILGMSFWTDGQSTKADNFFTQLGFGLESLGESYDLRLNGYFPLDRTQIGDPTLIDFDTPSFSGNELFAGLESITTDTAYSVVDAEAAKRIGDLDAWAILGAYYLGGGGADDAGVRAGMRGYALPDLAVSLQVTDDDIYHTNVMFGITWFVGRTHSGNAPCGVLADRFRDPVWRNDFIATSSVATTRAAGNPLTDADNNELFNFIHVNSNAPLGGDGTFENPYTTLAQAEAAQQDGSYVYVYSDSVLSGNFTAVDNVKVLGEGVNQDGDMVNHIVDSVELGTLTLPETSMGAGSLPAPIINGVGDVFTLANDNQINNFTINGGTNAVVGNAVNSPRLANLDINAPTGIGISFTDITGTPVVENTVTIDDAADTSFLIVGGEDGMNLNPIINTSVGRALEIRDRTGGTIAYGGMITTTGGTGVYIHDNTDANITFTDEIALTTDVDAAALTIMNNSADTATPSTIRFNGLLTTNTTGTGNGVDISGTDEDVTYRFADIVINSVDGTGFKAAGDGTLIVTSANGTNAVTATGTGTAIDIDGMLIGTGGANFDTVNTAGAAAEGVKLANLDGTAQVRIGSGTDPGDGGIIKSNGTGISIDNANNVVVNNVTIDNSANTGDGVRIINQDATTDAASFNGVQVTTSGAANGVVIGSATVPADGNSDGTITFTELVATSVNGNAVNVENNTGGTNIFNDLTATTSGTGDAVFIDSNDGSTTTINEMNLTATGTGNGFVATNKGAVAVTGATEISTVSGAALTMNDVEVDAAGVSIDKATVTGGTVDSISLVDLTGTGAVVVGADTTDAGSITTASRGVFIDNGTNTITVNTEVTANGAGRSLEVVDRTGGVVNYNSTTTDNGTGMRIANNTGGSVNVTDDLTFNTGANDSIAITGNNGATVNFTNAGSIDLGTSTGSGVHLTGQNSNVIVSADITGGTGTSVDIEGNATASVNGKITNTAGRSLQVHNLTAGTVNINGEVEDTGTGISIDTNTGGTVNVNGMTKLDTGGNDALTITGNSAGNTVNFGPGSQLDIDTTAGRGMVISGNGTTIINGTHTVDTGTGVGIEISNARSTTVNGVTVNTAGNNAVNVTHGNTSVANVTLNNVTVESGNRGVNVSASGSGQFDLTMNNVDISGISQEGVFFDTAGNANRVDFTMRNSNVVAGADQALEVNLGAAVGDVRFLVQDNVFNSNSTDATADIVVAGGTTFSGTIGFSSNSNDPPPAPIGDNNRFVNTSTGNPFAIEVNNAGATINLDLRDNTAAGGTVSYELTQTAGTFNLVDSVDTIAGDNNVGTVNTAGTINNINPPVLQPTP